MRPHQSSARRGLLFFCRTKKSLGYCSVVRPDLRVLLERQEWGRGRDRGSSGKGMGDTGARAGPDARRREVRAGRTIRTRPGPVRLNVGWARGPLDQKEILKMRRDVGTPLGGPRCARAARNSSRRRTPAEPILSPFHTAYPAAVGSRIDDLPALPPGRRCIRGTPTGTPSPRQGTASRRCARLDDSDGDTYGNGIEIAAPLLPQGDAADHPAPPADTLAPVVTNFSVPPDLHEPDGHDHRHHRDGRLGRAQGFLVTESATKPAAGTPGRPRFPGVTPRRPTGCTRCTPTPRTRRATSRTAAPPP